MGSKSRPHLLTVAGLDTGRAEKSIIKFYFVTFMWRGVLFSHFFADFFSKFYGIFLILKIFYSTKTAIYKYHVNFYHFVTSQKFCFTA